MEERDKIEIGFTFTDLYGNTYSSTSLVEPFYDLGDSDEMIIGEKLNCFLKQCGYLRNNDMIYMESVTEEEVQYLDDCLCEYREKEEE